MEWVKASERLPEKTGYYFVKHEINGAYILYVKDVTNMDHVTNWLDEKAPSLTIQQGLDIWDAGFIKGSYNQLPLKYKHTEVNPLDKAAYFASIGVDIDKLK